MSYGHFKLVVLVVTAIRSSKVLFKRFTHSWYFEIRSRWSTKANLAKALSWLCLQESVFIAHSLLLLFFLKV